MRNWRNTAELERAYVAFVYDHNNLKHGLFRSLDDAHKWYIAQRRKLSRGAIYFNGINGWTLIRWDH